MKLLLIIILISTLYSCGSISPYTLKSLDQFPEGLDNKEFKSYVDAKVREFENDNQFFKLTYKVLAANGLDLGFLESEFFIGAFYAKADEKKVFSHIKALSDLRYKNWKQNFIYINTDYCNYLRYYWDTNKKGKAILSAKQKKTVENLFEMTHFKNYNKYSYKFYMTCKCGVKN